MHFTTTAQKCWLVLGWLTFACSLAFWYHFVSTQQTAQQLRRIHQEEALRFIGSYAQEIDTSGRNRSNSKDVENNIYQTDERYSSNNDSSSNYFIANLTTSRKPVEDKSKATNSTTKIIYAATYNTKDYSLFNFSQCKYTNCIGKSYQHGVPLSEIDFDVGVFRFDQLRSSRFNKKLYTPWQKRQNQLWLLGFVESWCHTGNRWPSWVNDLFNGSSTFRRDSEVHWLYGKGAKKVHHSNSNPGTKIDYSKNKTKGAFAYVSNCHSVGYDRLALMRELGNYIEVDIFGGCTGRKMCKYQVDPACDVQMHAQYRFYLSFENSLCMDYITEKFWNRLQSPGLFLPVAVGGANLTDYTRSAPPDSFLHIYNFTSVDALGKYLQHLTTDDEAYNRYHEWRDNYEVFREYYELMPCQFCEIAHNMPRKPARPNLSDWWNNGPIGSMKGWQ